MEQTPRKKTALTVLLVIVIVIAALVVLFGSLCTCLCTCGACFDPYGCTKIPADPYACAGNLLPDVDSFDLSAMPEPTYPESWDFSETEPAATEPPATEPPTTEPTTAKPSSPLDQDNQISAGQAHADPSAWVREKRVQLKNDGTDTVTVLVLMNGSDLESEYGEATADLREMVRAEKSDRVNILVETAGTRNWDPYFGISARHAQRWKVGSGRLELLDDSLPQLDVTIPSTLSDFIRWGVQNYPADRYILLLWDHGGGPVYGFGYDEFQPYTATLTIDEIQTALKDGGVYFDLIGMDCCLMSSLEVCYALYDYCDYTLLSEDFEPACGWAHSEWLSALAKNPAIPTPELGRIAIDASVKAAEKKVRSDGGLTLALIDEAYTALLCPAWSSFAYRNESALLSKNYSQLRESVGRVHPRISRAVGGWTYSGGDASLDDYYITDVLSVALNVPSAESDALCAVLDQTVVYYGATSNETTLSGLSVTLPYGDSAFYNELRRVFQRAGINETYVAWLQKFVSVKTETEFYDFGGFGGWDDYAGGYDWSDWDVDLGDLLTWLLGNG